MRFGPKIYRDAGVYSCKLCAKSDGGFTIARHAGFDSGLKNDGTVSHWCSLRYRDFLCPSLGPMRFAICPTRDQAERSGSGRGERGAAILIDGQRANELRAMSFASFAICITTS